MVMRWVMFCEITPHVLANWFPINEKFFLFYPFLHPTKFNVHCLGPFCLTVAVTMSSAAELSVLIRVGGWVKPSSWSGMRRGTAVCPLWNSTLTSDSAVDATT